MDAAATASEGSACSAPSEPRSMLEQQEPSIAAAESRVTEVLQGIVMDVEARIFASLKDRASEVASHLAKEAVSRLLTAERKVAFLEQEIVYAKEQALSMLLRLKHHADSQVCDLEKLFLEEKRRADEAEAKASILQDLVRRIKRRGGESKASGKGKHLLLEEAATVNEDNLPNSLALIAGVACDFMEEPRAFSNIDNEEGKNNDSDIKVDSSSTHDGRVSSSHTRSRKRRKANAVEQQQEQPQGSAEERSSDETGSQEDGDDDDASAERGTSSGRRRPASSRRQKLKQKSTRPSSTLEALTKLMVGSKRTRHKAARTNEHKQRSMSEGSSRDSRRLMQGARQLFSLAEKKW